MIGIWDCNMIDEISFYIFQSFSTIQVVELLSFTNIAIAFYERYKTFEDIKVAVASATTFVFCVQLPKFC